MPIRLILMPADRIVRLRTGAQQPGEEGDAAFSIAQALQGPELESVRFSQVVELPGELALRSFA